MEQVWFEAIVAIHREEFDKEGKEEINDALAL